MPRHPPDLGRRPSRARTPLRPAPLKGPLAHDHALDPAHPHAARLRRPAGRKANRPRRPGHGPHDRAGVSPDGRERSEEHTSELQSIMRISYAVFCLKKKKIHVLSTSITITQKPNNTKNTHN